MKHTCVAAGMLILMAGTGWGKIDLVTLPGRESVQVTIYNSADMTLVREQRPLTLRRGLNSLQFSWANTLIDPTSLQMTPKERAETIDVFNLTYPPRAQNVGIWRVKSGFSGQVPVEITYLTSGLSWRAFYMGTMAPDETSMKLQGYVVVSNNSGEDYDNARTRLIVGKVHILDRISELARRQYPYGRPGVVRAPEGRARGFAGDKLMARKAVAEMAAMPRMERKEIRKEGLSEYFLYTIEGTESIPNGWSKRLPSFEAGEVDVVNLYKYEERRYGQSVRRFLSFKNDEDHNLGESPIPGGMLKVYRVADREGHLSYEGQSVFKYIPVDEDVELNLGAVTDVVVEPTLMDYGTESYLFDGNGDISGWDEKRTFKVEARNTRPVDVKVEIKRNFPTQHWDLEKSGDFGEYEKVDLDTVKFTFAVRAGEAREFDYVLTTRHGRRAE
ncbi:MAG: DUF4139 domain-containing protein [Kiritimatiellia bacterium]